MLSLLIFTLLCRHVFAKTDEEFKADFTKYIMTCLKDHPVDMKELTSLQMLKVPKHTETKCLLACAYRLAGTLNDKGMYDLEKANKIAESSMNGDEKRLANAKALVNVCAKANEVEVSDGAKGCERSALLFKCLIVNGPKYGFKV